MQKKIGQFFQKNLLINFLNKHQDIIFIIASIITVIGAVTYKSWVTEDAFITLRVVDNFINGNGLRWNIGERVQVYTHPLWMFYLSAFYFFTEEPFYTTIFASILVVLISMIIVALKTKNKTALFFTFAIGFIASKALTDFTTSGLEFPFTMLGLTMLFLEFRKADRKVWVIYLWGCFLALNRLDLCLLAIPACLYALFTDSKRNWINRIGLAILCGMPLFLWLLFATIYYGFPFPNTYYAKLHGEIPPYYLWDNGFLYLRTLFITDLVSGIIMLAPLVLVKINRISVIFYLSCLVYGIYTNSIGGDFMMGRMYCPIIYTCLLLLIFEPKENYKNLKPQISFVLTTIAVLIYTNFIVEQKGDRAFIFNQFADERAYYKNSNWLISKEPWHQDHMGRFAKNILRQNTSFLIHGNVGILGFLAQDKIHIVDTFALTEPLLARTPNDSKSHWRVGHIRRKVPKGYEEFLKKGDSLHMNYNLKIYAKAIRSLTKEKLFNKNRLEVLLDFNLGRYNKYLDRYKKQTFVKK